MGCTGITDRTKNRFAKTRGSGRGERPGIPGTPRIGARPNSNIAAIIEQEIGRIQAEEGVLGSSAATAWNFREACARILSSMPANGGGRRRSSLPAHRRDARSTLRLVERAVAPGVLRRGWTAQMVLVYFVYGLAFFSMGFAIALESRRSSGLRLATSLFFLAAFALLHSLVEWSDMLLLIDSAMPPTLEMERVRLVRTLLLGISTGALLQFGTELLATQARRPLISPANVLRLLPLTLGLAWVAILAALAPTYHPGTRQWLVQADIWARYLLYLPGSTLAGFGLLAEGRILEKTHFRQVARDSRFAAATFLLNALLAGAVVPPDQNLSGLPLNYDTFQDVFGFPVQILQALSAVAIAFFIVRLLRVFAIQRAREVELATQSQIQAQQESLDVQRRARAEIEQLNRELEDRIRQRTAEISLRNRQLLAVNGIAASVSQSFDLKEILNQTLDRTLEALAADGGGIFLSSREGGDGLTHLSKGLPDEFVRTVSRASFDAVVAAQLADPHDVGRGTGGEKDPPWPNVRSFVTAPLRTKGRMVGVICVSRAKEAAFDAEEARLLTAIGHQVAIAVENARLFAQLQKMAALEERERLAREMHDGLAQVIGFLSIKTRVVQQLVSSGQLQQAEADLEQMRCTVQDAYADVRQSIFSLRAATELDRGLLAAVRDSANDFSEQNSVPVELALPEEGEVSFPPEAEVQLVRIVQEALANVRKHARATKVWIRLERRDGETILTVEDDGVGFDPKQMADRKRHCFGLQTMGERAESIGARLEVTSVPGEGTRIQVRYGREQSSTEPERSAESPAG